MGKDLDILDVGSRYTFVLSSFALDKVRTVVYRKGKASDTKNSGTDYKGSPMREPFEAEGFETRNSDKGVSNMHTGSNATQPMSILGTPVFCDMIISAETNGVSGAGDTLQLLWILVEVTQTKNIVKTSMLGTDGTVKEYISQGDYMVKMRGALVNTFRKDYPKSQVEKLIRIFQKGQALSVVSEYLVMFGIYNIVVEDFTFGQVEGRQNIQKFEASCSSDQPLKLRKKRGV
ncbi:MAG: DUF6046 domain-containing protein [Sediminibacterium sp.]|nr:DUF6046 domain-containing protein [Sediminibacterium sp.]MDP3128826.1 DUF6046 domain-containing protein [Sediminibacterium sp.]